MTKYTDTGPLDPFGRTGVSYWFFGGRNEGETRPSANCLNSYSFAVLTEGHQSR